MSRSADQSTQSGFAQFPDVKARDRFVQAVLDPAPKLKSRAYVSGSQPTILFEQLTTQERDRVISALEGVGRWFDDVQFRTTS
jgi:hypothetical protein